MRLLSMRSTLSRLQATRFPVSSNILCVFHGRHLFIFMYPREDDRYFSFQRYRHDGCFRTVRSILDAGSASTEQDEQNNRRPPPLFEHGGFHDRDRIQGEAMKP